MSSAPPREVDASSPRYVDDLLVVVEGAPPLISLNIGAILSVAADEFIIRGLSLKHGPGKSYHSSCVGP